MRKLSASGPRSCVSARPRRRSNSTTTAQPLLSWTEELIHSLSGRLSGSARSEARRQIAELWCRPCSRCPCQHPKRPVTVGQLTLRRGAHAELLQRRSRGLLRRGADLVQPVAAHGHGRATHFAPARTRWAPPTSAPRPPQSCGEAPTSCSRPGGVAAHGHGCAIYYNNTGYTNWCYSRISTNGAVESSHLGDRSPDLCSSL